MNNYRMAYLNHSRRLAPTFRRLTPPLIRRRRSVSTSIYDKNPEDHAHPTVVPDEVIQPKSDQYWAPHPKTGVFGPAMEQNPAVERSFHNSTVSTTTAAEDSVLEQKTFFRPHEDLEKPPPQP
ncbi:OLC1v1021039C1 [Oldenlandia corymbosa var. corymbosa]|uniref:OLC1v1021039C1 n=1 Tax=Oldenlandia corymbosa var. corymbosa TaxID=529605 RepID=A0AAV1BWA3_OLDCO|nr:OLC1v1021039C1 [Oldenlandia corymbosa var. corymbosa]